MRDLHKLGESRDLKKVTTLQEDLAWWSVVNLFSLVIKSVEYFDDETWNYKDMKFTKRLPDWLVDSLAGSVTTVEMLRTNTSKMMVALAVQSVSKISRRS